MASLSDMRAHNKKIGHHFFEKGNPPVVAKHGNGLVTGGYSSGFVVYKYDPSTGKITFQKHYDSKPDAVQGAKKLN